MLIQTLRKQITVSNYCATNNAVYVEYFRSHSGQSMRKQIILSPLEYLKMLNTTAMIDGVNEQPLSVIIDDKTYSYLDYVIEFPMCQWEGIELAVGHELDIETGEEVAAGDIGIAINALK